ncbi:MAG TPA: hypothetical protein VEJ63_16595 [Planctomycetota bacterium]|nr:hypothetical protein [Planctomycetota bacterium]
MIINLTPNAPLQYRPYRYKSWRFDQHYGWPLSFVRQGVDTIVTEDDSGNTIAFTRGEVHEPELVSVYGLLINVLVWLVVMRLVCKWLESRIELRTGAQT